MKDKDVVAGQRYRVKKDLPRGCWNDIHLEKAKWEGVIVVADEKGKARNIFTPYDTCRARTSSWYVRRHDKPGVWWLPAYALESMCMFQ